MLNGNGHAFDLAAYRAGALAHAGSRACGGSFFGPLAEGMSGSGDSSVGCKALVGQLLQALHLGGIAENGDELRLGSAAGVIAERAGDK